jgi:hypothetical protein
MSSSVSTVSDFNRQHQEQTAYTSFSAAKRSHNTAIPAFGSKEERSTAEFDYKKEFNRDPGPGSYSENVSTVESMTA